MPCGIKYGRPCLGSETQHLAFLPGTLKSCIILESGGRRVYRYPGHRIHPYRRLWNSDLTQYEV